MELEDRAGAGSFVNCSKLNDHDVRVLAMARGGTGVVCFLVCALTVVVMVSKRGLAGMRDSTQTRLMSYLLLSTAAYLLVLSGHIEHYWNYRGSSSKDPTQRNNWQVDLCMAVGMADQYTGSVQLFFSIGVALHFIYHSLVFFCSAKSGTAHLYFIRGLSQRQKRVLEALLVVAALVVPALYVWVPFIAVPYGETGPWCWIKTLDRQCKTRRGSFWEQMGIWYIPFGITALFSLFAIVLFLAGVRYYFPKLKRQRGQKKGEAVVLIVFLATYSLLSLVEIVSYCVSVKLSRDYFGVWLLYALSTPLGVVSLPIGLLIYSFTGTLREAAKQYITCHCIRRTPLFVKIFRDPSSFTHVPQRGTSDSDHWSIVPEEV